MVFFAQNLKRNIWLARHTIVDGVKQYTIPVMYAWNWRTLSSDAEMMTYGPSYADYRVATLSNDEVADIKVGDRIWNTSPTYDILARDAEFEINSIVIGAGGIARVTFKKLSPDG